MKEIIMLKSVFVGQLFGRFDYNLNFKYSNDHSKALTIITAPNGYGKSTILRLIDDLLRGNYSKLVRTSFDELILESTDDRGIYVTRKINISPEGLEENVTLEFRSTYKGKNLQSTTNSWSITVQQSQNNDAEEDMNISRRYDFSIVEFAERTLKLRRAGLNGWRDPNNGQLYSRAEILDRYESQRLNNLGNVEPKWLIDFRKSLPVLYISANRLRVDLEIQSHRRIQAGEKVEVISEKVLDQIRDFNRSYAEAGRRLEQDFASRVISALGANSKVSEIEVGQLMEKVRIMEDEYQKLGLLSAGQSVKTHDFPKDISALKVLNIYLEDIYQKISSLERPVNRLKLFVQTLNSMLIFKKIVLNSNAGFIVIGDDQKNIPLKSLSSGEQHLIVLLGELIFESINIRAVLLDEPEISFHPAWQEQFPEVLAKIVSMNGCMIVVATHSPTVIGDNWESVIELAEQVPI